MHLNFFSLKWFRQDIFFQFELIVVAFSLDHIMSKNVEQQSYGFKQIFPSIGWTLGPALEGLHPHEIKMTVVQFNKIWFVKLQAWPLVFDLNVADTIVKKKFLRIVDKGLNKSTEQQALWKYLLTNIFHISTASVS